MSVTSKNVPFLSKMIIFLIVNVFARKVIGNDWFEYDGKYDFSQILAKDISYSSSYLLFKTTLKEPLNWQANKKYCEKYDSSLIFLGNKNKSKFLQNKMASILRNNQLKQLNSLRPNRVTDQIIFIGKFFDNFDHFLTWFRWKIFKMGDIR